MGTIESTSGSLAALPDAGLESWHTQRAVGSPFGYWQNLICRELVELQIETPAPDRFEASLVRRHVGSISVNLISARAQAAARTHEAIRRMIEPRFDLVHIREGYVNLQHYGRRFEIHPGQCVLIDNSQTYSFVTSELSKSTSLQIPQKWLRTLIPMPEDGVANIITDETPWGNALLATLNALTPHSLANLTVPGQALAEQIGSLLALAIAKREPVLTSTHQKLLMRLRATLRARAHDEQLTPQSVADTNGISRRYLHALFARAGTTFTRDLLDIRLDLAQRLLLDPRFRRMTVAEIGWRCGFVDSSHFARRFRIRFGHSPTEYRHERPLARSAIGPPTQV
jgi:AraC-like DNA-binding protein